ncbi:hypothetical protein [Collimonas silvisoli]|uniref:hypothetical protein n=1 Tax=Collimonas silvisoli TaxID=2825884 RepID=UPI001B8D0A34|nr:hypothetical protein [Collimonas silvisoli]
MSSELKYANAQISVSNAAVAQQIIVELQPKQANDKISWSTGDPAKTEATGIQIKTTGGVAVPLTQFSVNGLLITLNIGGDSTGTVSFNLSSFLVANINLSEFKIKTTNDGSPVVTFNFSGYESTTLSQTFVTLDWPTP